MPGSTLAFGASVGRTTAQGGAQRLINGLTISQYLWVFAPSTNGDMVYLGDANVSASNCFPLYPGMAPIQIDTGCTRDRWYVSTNGTTQAVHYITAANEQG